VAVVQFAEGLSGRQAADAVRGRLDWRYALGLPLEDAGFDYSVLSEVRARLLAGGAEAKLLDVLLDRCKAAAAKPPGWGGRAGGSARTRPASRPPGAPSPARDSSGKRCGGR
jgi:hypothetical protein